MDLTHILNQTRAAQSASTQTREASGELNLSTLKAGTEIKALVEKVYQLTTRQTQLLEKMGWAQNPTPGNSAPLIKNNSQATSSAHATNTAPQTPINSTLTNSTDSKSTLKLPLFLVQLRSQGKTFSLLTPKPESVPAKPVFILGQNNALILKGAASSSQNVPQPISQKPNNTAFSNTQPSSTTTTKSSYTDKSDTRTNQSPYSSPTTSQNVYSRSESAQRHQATQQASMASLISDGLRQHLPQQKPISETMTLLHQLATNLNDINISKKTNQLELLARIIRTNLSAEFIQAKGINATKLEQSILRSGHFLENTLKNIAQQNAATSVAEKNTPIKNAAPTQRTPQSSAESDTLFSRPITKKDPVLANTSNRVSQEVLTQDTKATLLKVSEILSQILSQPASTKMPSTTDADETLTQLILNIFNRASNSQKETSASVQEKLRDALKLMQQQVNGVIAKVTTSQLRHLSQQVQDPALTPNGGFIELPIRFGETTIPLHLAIFEREEEQENPDSEQNETKEKRRKWKVFMELELDQYGYFATELSLVDNTIKTTFWIENSRVESTAKAQLNTLKKDLLDSGVEIEEVHFSNTPPPHRDQGIQQSLVDIET